MSLPPWPALVRPLVRRLQPYVPGEQPKLKGFIKLNTNENPYPPSPKVLAATRAAVDARLRLYPDPSAQALRARLARLHSCRPENFMVGNGSDELLNLAVRALVEPQTGSAARPPRPAGVPARPPSQSLLQYFVPSYSLYPVLAEIQGAARLGLPLQPDFSLPSLNELRRGGHWDFRAALTIITTPNAPSGRGYLTAELEALCRAQKGAVLLDEAYADFAREQALALALKYPHVLVARTFSKAYSLCFQRVGYLVGHPGLIAALHKIRDSYNVNGLGQVAALATLDDLPYYRARFRIIIRTRQRLTRQLAELGFQVFPSQANFILARPPRFAAQTWLEMLRQRKVLVRWFDLPLVRDCLRLTVGTPAQAAALIAAARKILSSQKQVAVACRLAYSNTALRE